MVGTPMGLSSHFSLCHHMRPHYSTTGRLRFLWFIGQYPDRFFEISNNIVETGIRALHYQGSKILDTIHVFYFNSAAIIQVILGVFFKPPCKQSIAQLLLAVARFTQV